MMNSRDSCPVCGKTVSINNNGVLRKHTEPKKPDDRIAEICNGTGISAPSRRAVNPVESSWQSVDEFAATGRAGTRRYTVRVGDRCKVAGLGRNGAAGAGWEVTGIQRHADTGDTNVTVLRRRDSRERIVKAERIVAQPRKSRQRRSS